MSANGKKMGVRNHFFFSLRQAAASSPFVFSRKTTLIFYEWSKLSLFHSYTATAAATAALTLKNFPFVVCEHKK